MLTTSAAQDLRERLESELRYRREVESLQFERPPTPDEARRHLLSFVRWSFPDYQVGWVHALICERLEQFVDDLNAGKQPRLILTMPPRYGKALELGTPVPTPDGFVAIEDLRPGDLVFAPDGRVVKVIARSEVWRDRPLYRVSTDDGASVIADGNHLWYARLCRKRPVYKLRSTTALAARECDRRAQIPSHQALDLPDIDLPVDPWVLGAWLGDGTSLQAIMTASDADMPYMRASFETAGFTTTDQSTPNTFGVRNLKSRLLKLDLIGNKHIPAQYLRASRHQRLRLLQGLIDTDGHVSPSGQIEFCSTREQLACQVLELVRTLGSKASLIRGRATLHGRDVGPKFRVMFYLPEAAAMPRKAARCRARGRRDGRYLSVERLDRKGDTVCIQVEGGMFLVGEGFMATHNSEIVSRRLPVWFMGNNPGASVGVCSYGQDLADDMSRDARRIRDESLAVFPHLAASSSGVDRASRWDTQGGGSYLAAGVGGPLTGRGFSLGIIDDPVKNMQDADSEAERNTVWSWYESTFYTRRAPKAGLLVMATRWHEDDLIGRLLAKAKEGGDQWELIEFPALANEEERHPRTGRVLRQAGEALHPERYPQADVEQTKRAMSARVWSALYDCKPTSKAGKLFKREWYRDRYTFDPQRPPKPWTEVGISIDCNFKVANDAAYVSIGVWGRWDHAERYRLDEVRERLGYVDMRARVQELCWKWRPNFVLIEEAANGHALIDDLRQVHPGVIAFKPSEYGSKEARAEVASPTHEAGCVRLPATAPWVGDWVEEHVNFPVGTYKDRVDEGAQLVIYLAARAREGSTGAVVSATKTMLSLFGAG